MLSFRKNIIERGAPLPYVIRSGPIDEDLQSAQSRCMNGIEVPIIFSIGEATTMCVSVTVHLTRLQHDPNGSWVFEGYCGTIPSQRTEARGIYDAIRKRGELTLMPSTPPPVR